MGFSTAVPKRPYLHAWGRFSAQLPYVRHYFNTTLAQDVDRFRFLRSLPGTYVFVQPYRPVPGGCPPSVEGFLDEQADALLDDLIRIVFPQNMKSMENYYRWVSGLYAQTFGRPHMGLVDTIFRYNNRERRGHYLATLAAGIERSDACACISHSKRRRESSRLL